MLPNPSKCHIRPQIKKSRVFIIKKQSLRAPPSTADNETSAINETNAANAANPVDRQLVYASGPSTSPVGPLRVRVSACASV